jgi:hypothetical protein
MFNNIGDIMKKHLLLLMFMAMILSVSAGTITLQQQASEVRILSSSSEGLVCGFMDRIRNEINTKKALTILPENIPLQNS